MPLILTENLKKYYLPTLYVVLALLIFFNVPALVAGRRLAVFVIAVDLAVLVFVYTGSAWAYIVVRIWSMISIIAGVSMWLAVLLAGVAYFYSVLHAVSSTLMLVFGLYFFAFAKQALKRNEVASN
jgi:hypothetical protein